MCAENLLHRNTFLEQFSVAVPSLTCDSLATISFQFKVVLLIERMASDWDRTAPNMRKAWGYKDTLALHAATGGFLQFLRVLKEKLPGAEYDKHRDNLMAQFRLGALDPDIVHSLETTVPPGSLDSVSFLRPGAALCVLVPPKRII